MTKPDDKVILIDLEGSFKNVIFSSYQKSEAKKAVENLAKKFKVIYLSKLAGKRIASFWLEQEDFPESVVLRWRGPDLFESLNRKGLTLYALVASPEILSESTKYVEHRFSFEKTADGQTVGNWAELIELLKPQKDAHEDRPPEQSATP